MILLRLLLIAALLCTAQAAYSTETDEFFSEFAKCSGIAYELERVQCYDKLADRLGAGQAEFDAPGIPAIDSAEIQHRSERLEEQIQFERYRRLGADDPNYYVVAAPVDDDLGDETHFEFYISQRYALVEEWLAKRRYANPGNAGEFYWRDRNAVVAPGRGWVPDRLYFIYNGLYDFYALDSDRYSSSPVISRRQNPGLALEWDFNQRRERLRFSYFHESNGQTLGPDDPENGDADELAAAQRNYRRQVSRYGEDFALAEISRGWDYLSMRWEKASSSRLLDFKPDWYRIHVEGRHYLDKQLFSAEREDSIWWDPGNRARIEDYDGLRIAYEHGFQALSRPWLGRIEYKGGVASVDSLSNASWRLSLGVRLWNTHFYGFYFDGYGREPSTYHLRTQYAGLGIELR